MKSKQMVTEKLKQETQAEWRSLGFYYDYEEAARAWLIRGSHEGLRRFTASLRSYAQERSHALLSQHEHYGPYSYLKFVTWVSPKIAADGLYGRLADFRQLADLVDGKLLRSALASRIQIDAADYGTENEAVLILEVAPVDFDPAKADQAIW
jgi:hypothetical protein